MRGLGRLHRSQYGEIPATPWNEVDEIGGTMPEGSERIPETQESEGFAKYLRTGQRAAGEFRCSRCRYGVIVQVELPRCPMCSGTAWERRTGAR
jgi:hypothetical protein